MKTAKENRENLAKLDFCRTYLFLNGFITYAENEKVFQRIRKWQDKHKVEISEEQILSVNMIYDDNAKVEE